MTTDNVVGARCGDLLVLEPRDKRVGERFGFGRECHGEGGVSDPVAEGKLNGSRAVWGLRGVDRTGSLREATMGHQGISERQKKD